jgi:hypothetical protein
MPPASHARLPSGRHTVPPFPGGCCRAGRAYRPRASPATLRATLCQPPHTHAFLPPPPPPPPYTHTAEPKIALLGAMQALFEGSMYTFVFLWTPALRCAACGATCCAACCMVYCRSCFPGCTLGSAARPPAQPRRRLHPAQPARGAHPPRHGVCVLHGLLHGRQRAGRAPAGQRQPVEAAELHAGAPVQRGPPVHLGWLPPGHSGWMVGGRRMRWAAVLTAWSLSRRLCLSHTHRPLPDRRAVGCPPPPCRPVTAPLCPPFPRWCLACLRCACLCRSCSIVRESRRRSSSRAPGAQHAQPAADCCCLAGLVYGAGGQAPLMLRPARALRRSHQPRPPARPPLCRQGLTFEGQLQLLAFCAFEVLVGVFWPSMMTMRRWADQGGRRKRRKGRQGGEGILQMQDAAPVMGLMPCCTTDANLDPSPRCWGNHPRPAPPRPAPPRPAPLLREP